MWSTNHPSFNFEIESKNDIREILLDPFNPDYAVFDDGKVLYMEYYDKIVTM